MSASVMRRQIVGSRWLATEAGTPARDRSTSHEGSNGRCGNSLHRGP
jgi:hypothetical protein